jgi:hypothetical protein
MADLWRGFWIRETGTGQQVTQLHDRYMMIKTVLFFWSFMAKLNAVGSTSKSTPTKLSVSILIRNGSAIALNYCIFRCDYVQKIKFFSQNNTKCNIWKRKHLLSRPWSNVVFIFHIQNFRNVTTVILIISIISSSDTLHSATFYGRLVRFNECFLQRP